MVRPLENDDVRLELSYIYHDQQIQIQQDNNARAIPASVGPLADP